MGAEIPDSPEGIQGKDMPAGAIIFTHIDEVTKRVTTYSVTHLWLKVQREGKAGRLNATRVIVDAKFAKYCRENRGIERHRLNRIKAKDLETPVLFCTQLDGSHLLVDGSHRYVKAHTMVKRTIPAFILPFEFWAPCVVHMDEEGVTPEILKSMYSGIS